MKALVRFLSSRHSPAPLAVFRIFFGAMMFMAVIRFWSKGWIKTQYIDPKFFFSWGGLNLQPPSNLGMYLIFAVMGLAALGILLGLKYRLSCLLFFFTFTFVELIDKTNYLNHYYFVSVVSFLLVFLPAHRIFSLDRFFGKVKCETWVPRWTVFVLQIQVALVYFYAGIAKINGDWLLQAMPLKIWLPANADLFLLGPLFDYTWVAYFFSWAGMLFDTTIVLWLCLPQTRWAAYVCVLAFHLLTAVLFPIGIFPFVMIGAATIFFPPKSHEFVIKVLGGYAIAKQRLASYVNPRSITAGHTRRQWVVPACLGLFLLVQAVLPMRYLLYPKDLFWHEQGFRFSWRVMLIEKAGYAEFRVRDRQGRETWVSNCDYLTPQQEKMMATQPDMLLQFAHHLRDEFRDKGWENPEVYVDSWVTLNGRGSRRFVNSDVNLAAVSSARTRTQWLNPSGI